MIILHADTTLTDFIRTWLAMMCGDLEQTTQVQYQHIIDRYIRPFFESTLLSDIDEDILQSFLNSLGEHGAGLSSQTLHIVKTILHQSFQTFLNPVYKGISK